MDTFNEPFREEYFGEKVDKGWNPPDVPLSVCSSSFKDLNGDELKGPCKPIFYKFPWYLCFMPLWYKMKHWWKNDEWPVAVFYFRDDQQTDKRIFLDVIQHPQDFYSAGGYEPPPSNPGRTFDDFIAEVDAETAAFEERVQREFYAKSEASNS